MLGKRKRETTAATRRNRGSFLSESSSKDGENDTKAIFKSYFEAQFAPIEEGKEGEELQVTSEEKTGLVNEESDSGWSGISGDEDVGVEIVEHTRNTVPQRDEIEKYESMSFMSSRPPSTARSSTRKPKSSTDDDEDSKTEAVNLTNDLALQHLLRESHLLSSNPTSKLSHSGSSRHKAIDLRLQSLGSKESILTQKKMPLAHRKGIVEKGITKEDRRRKEAKENGIVLERKGGKERRRGGKRELEVDGPGVGRWKDGMLRLSGRDVSSIEGPKKRAVKGRKKGKR